MHQSLPMHLPATPSRRPLEALAHLSIIVLTISFVGTAVLNWLAQQASRAAATAAQRGTIPNTSYANLEGAHFTFTNMASFPQWSCVRGTLTNLKTRAAIMSFPICTGELAPHASVTITSHFAGDVRDVCGKDGGTFGRTLDWDSCSFETGEATEKDLVGR